MEITLKYNWPCPQFEHWMITSNVSGRGYSGDYKVTYCYRCEYAAEFNKDFAPAGHLDHPKGCRCNSENHSTSAEGMEAYRRRHRTLEDVEKSDNMCNN